MTWPAGTTRPYIEADTPESRERLGMPEGAATERIWIAGAAVGQAWRLHVVELFGIVRHEPGPSPTGIQHVLGAVAATPAPADWPSLHHAFQHHYARGPVPALDVYQRIVWVDGCRSYLEWSGRSREIVHRHVEAEVRVSDAQRVLRGRALLRADARGRPRGSMFYTEELVARVPLIVKRLRDAERSVSLDTVAEALDCSRDTLLRSVKASGLRWRDIKGLRSD